MEASTCALEALRDGAVGCVFWRERISKGQFDEFGQVTMFADRVAQQSHGGMVDISYYDVEEVVVGPLEPAHVFADCLADTGLLTRFKCVRHADDAGVAVCQEESQNCSGV